MNPALLGSGRKSPLVHQERSSWGARGPVLVVLICGLAAMWHNLFFGAADVARVASVGLTGGSMSNVDGRAAGGNNATSTPWVK